MRTNALPHRPARGLLPALRRGLTTLHEAGVRRLGRLWPPLQFAPLWPDIPHRRAPGISGALFGHGRLYYEQIMGERQRMPDWAARHGIAQLAEDSGGVCTFRMGPAPAIYITDSAQKNNLIRNGKCSLNPLYDGPLIRSRALIVPSTDDAQYRRDRLAIERNLGKAAFRHGGMRRLVRDAERAVARITARRRSLPLVDLVLYALLDVESRIPGLLDLNTRTLADIAFSSPESLEAYRASVLELVDYLHEGRMYDAAKRAHLVRHFREVFDEAVFANFDDIHRAPATNVIRLWFTKHFGRPFPVSPGALREMLAARPDAHQNLAMDMGIVFLVGMFSNTLNNLTWTIAELDAHPEIRRRLVDEVRSVELDALRHRATALSALAYTQDVVLETVRFHPPVLISGGQVVEPYEVELHGRRRWLPRGTVVLADLRRCGRNDSTYPDPTRFNPENIAASRRRGPKRDTARTTAQLLYTDEAFSAFGGGSRRCPVSHGRGVTRRCPGRIYTVMVQTAVLVAIYRHHEVQLIASDSTLGDGIGLITHPLHTSDVRLRPRLDAPRDRVTRPLAPVGACPFHGAP